ncbi:hypothetical protein Salat_1168000 [Sesamum alatum]|uniref:Uncharacterized protein n=1 Tax=Sesamum alatum TaxID=300844 RepID=A0AAE1YEP7_9LAMI|nr:hypothetical protein Salat_1168000 [Sesamum alatum]
MSPSPITNPSLNKSPSHELPLIPSPTIYSTLSPTTHLAQPPRAGGTENEMRPALRTYLLPLIQYTHNPAKKTTPQPPPPAYVSEPTSRPTMTLKGLSPSGENAHWNKERLLSKEGACGGAISMLSSPGSESSQSMGFERDSLVHVLVTITMEL